MFIIFFLHSKVFHFHIKFFLKWVKNKIRNHTNNMQSFAFVLLLLLLLNRVILCDFYIEQRKKRWPGGWVLYCNCTLGSVVVFLWKLENNSKKFGVSRYDDERVFEEFSFSFLFFLLTRFSQIYI